MKTQILILLLITSIFLVGCDAPPTFAFPTTTATYTTLLKQLGIESIAEGKISSAANNDVCLAVTQDRSSNFYCAGYTESNLKEANGGLRDIFIMKVNSSGTTVWVTHLGSATAASSSLIDSTAGSEACTGIAVDGSGNVFCSGITSGNLAEPNGGGTDVVLLKLNSNGILQWIKQIGATTEAASTFVGSTAGNESGGKLALDSSNNLYIAGVTTGAFNEPNGGGQDIIIVKFNSSGDIQGAKQLGATTEATSTPLESAAGDDVCNDIEVTSAGDIFCAGTTSGGFGEANGGGDDAFVAKFNSTGTPQWIMQMGVATAAASSHVQSPAGNDICRGIAIDSSSNVYCAGSTDGGLGEANGGSDDIFAIKLNSSGIIQWLSQLGATTAAASAVVGTTTASEGCFGLAVDSRGSVFCSGEADGPLGEAVGPGGFDAFAMKWSTAGTVQWIRQFGSASVTDPGYIGSAATDISVGFNSYIYLGGVVIGDLAETTGGGGNTDIFVARLKPDGSL